MAGITPTGYPLADSVSVVVDAYNKYGAKGDEWLLKASNALDELDQVYVEPISFNVDYNIGAFAPRFTRPDRPDDPEVSAIVVDTPDQPDLDPVAVRTLGEAPTEPDLTAYLDYHPPAAPTTPVPTRPSDINVVLDPIDVAARPDYVLPTRPDLYELVLTDFEPITIPEFDGVKPLIDLPELDDGQLAYTDKVYSSELLDAMKVVLAGMMQGGSGLPLAVEQAIFDRGRAREDRLSRKQIQEVSEDMSVRGLPEGNGILAARLREVRADNRGKVAGLNRDLTIDTATKALENVKFSIAQGMALEQTLIQQSEQINDRALKIAIYVRDYGLQRLNALIARANLEQQAYATEAQVWKQKIDAALSALEVRKAEIDEQRVRGEFNKNLIEQYNTEYTALKTLAEFYQTDVEAAKTKGEINLQRIEAAKLILERYSTEVDAYGKVQDAWKTQTEAALGRTKFAETLANIFATQMQGYKTKGDAFFNEGRFGIEKNGQTLELFRSNLARSDQNLRAQLGELDARLRVHGAKVALYEADGNMAQAESAAYDRTVSLKIQNETNRTSVALQQAQMRIDQMLKSAELLVEQIKAKAAALSQLAGSSQAGVNVGASISGSGSQSASWGVNWSGEAPDYAGALAFS
jgi:hypothetical protein